jgi:hypothetical protein
MLLAKRKEQPVMGPTAPSRPDDPLYVFRRDVEPRYERAREHVRYEAEPRTPDLLRLSRLLRGLPVKDENGRG